MKLSIFMSLYIMYVCSQIFWKNRTYRNKPKPLPSLKYQLRLTTVLRFFIGGSINKITSVYWLTSLKREKNKEIMCHNVLSYYDSANISTRQSGLLYPRDHDLCIVLHVTPRDHDLCIVLHLTPRVAKCCQQL